MKNKSTLLNVILALVIVVLTVQLVAKHSTKEAPKQEHRKEHRESASEKKSQIDPTNNEKVSLGPQPEIMPKPALVIGSYSADNEPDIMTAAWAGIVNSSPLCVGVSVRPSRKTYDNIMATGSFTINVPSEQYVAEMDYVGNISGHNEDKFKKLGLTPVKSELVNAPYVGEFPIVLECKVIDTLHLGTHVQFIGEVMDTKANRNVLYANGKRVDAKKVKPIIFEHGSYFAYGKPLGKPFHIYKTLLDGYIAPENSDDNTPIDNETLTTIFNRKSVRNYTNRKVSKEQLTILSKAGMAAPTAVDKRPWAFIAITEREMLDQLADSLPYAKMLSKATAAIVVCGDLDKALSGDAQPYWVQDCSAATENILLAAESMGLGAVWTGVHPITEREKTVRNILKFPDSIVPLCVIAIGYPTGTEKPKDKWDPSILHWERW